MSPVSCATSLDHLITDIDIGNERIKCIKFETDQPLLIVCVYLPCDGEKDNYHTFVETIEQLQEIITTFHTTHGILIGGDFNDGNGSFRPLSRSP